ncbi:Protein MAIN-LIKE 1 [Bienertia sinuspersici]
MSGLGRGGRRSKRSNLDYNVGDTQLSQRQRPTASERARKKKIISSDTSMVEDLPFAPEFREQNQYDDQYLDGFERALEHSGKGNGTSSQIGKDKGWISKIDDDDDDEEEEEEEEGEQEEGEQEDSDEEDGNGEQEEEEEDEDSPKKQFVSIGSRQSKFQVRGRFGIQKHKEELRLEEYSELKDAIDGGPMNPELLKSFRGHVAYYIWHGQDRNVLKGHKQTKRLSKWKPQSGEAKSLIMRSELSHLVDCMHSNLNMPLISAFVERWHPETNSFHLPFGEMTITLHDVAYILRIPVVGEAIFGNPKSKDLKGHLGGILNMSEVDVNKEYHSGSTLFVDRSGTSVSAYYLPYLLDLEKVKDYAWGAVCLAYMYRQLGVASRFDNAQIGGCLTLLQYFPAFGPQRRQNWVPTMPYASQWLSTLINPNANDALHSYRRLLDEIRVDEVIPMRLFSPKTCYRGPENNKYKCNHDENLRSWETWQHHCIRVGEVGAYRANFATEIVDGYLQYYISRSHVRITKDEHAEPSDIPPPQMPDAARLQFIGARLYPLHPEVRHQTDDVTFWQCINDLTQHMEDWMPRLQEERQRRRLGGFSRMGGHISGRGL